MINDNTYGLRDIHNKLLMIFIDFHRLCIDNNIKYSVFAGTMLGAVREKGFIPWDDDIDVVMDLKNYNKLRKVLKTNHDYYLDLYDAWVPRFKSTKDKKGTFVDIFLITEAPKGITKTITVYKLKALQGMLKKYTTVKKISVIYKVLLKITKTIGKLFSRKFLLKQYWKIGYRTKYISNKYYVPNIGFNYLNMEFDKKRLDAGYSEIAFENITVSIFKEYDYMLKVHFGEDYMIPINESERISYHSEQIKR